MSRHAVRGIGQVIKANTTEKSIDELRAEGKHRVRVVSSERVMAIIQAIVDDTINSEVGEITSRDRERIVSDTQDRFSRVLQMQQDLEQKVDNLRGSLRDTELQRDSLGADKALLESQLASARRVDGDADAVAKLSRDLIRVRDAVERAPRDAGVLDDAAVSRVADKLAAREVQSTRRITAEFDDLRTRLHDAVAELHDEIAALSARGVDADERRRQTVRELSDQIARSAAVQSHALETNFKGALEQALDKITRTMERATARPIETSGEATEVLLSKIFDGPDGEVTSNLDQLEVEARRSRDGIAKSVGRLRAMNSLAATAAE
jgi:hypothetical protein